MAIKLQLTPKRCLIGLAIICLLIIIIKLLVELIRWYLAYRAYQRYETSKLKVLLETNDNAVPTTRYNVIFFYSHNYKKLPDYFAPGYQILSTYCEQHKYKLLVIDHSNDTELISPYWLRVKDLVDLSQQYPESNNLFVYLDLDTCLNPTHMNVPIEQLINRMDHLNQKPWDMYVGTDCIAYMNTGGLIVKNTDWSKQLLLLWWSKYALSRWVYSNAKWTCHTNAGNQCGWARDGYEQGELNNIYEQNELDTRNHLLIMNSSIISNSLIELDSFIYHFYGSKIELDSFIYYFYGDKNRKPVYDRLYQQYLELVQKKI